MTEETTDAATEATSEAATDAATEATSEAATDAATEATIEAAIDATSEAATDAVTEATSEAATDATIEAAAHPASQATIAPMTQGDLDEVDLIERVSFKEPWPPQTFAEELTRPFARVDVVRVDGRIIGFANYWLVAGEVSLLAIAIHPDLRRRGHAAQLLTHVLEQSRRAGCERVFLEVRRGNQPAIALYQRHGFTTLHSRTAYYADGEDALVMSVELAQP
jgi:ribosomal-protein-alanine N-acetyltransferase